MKFYRAMKALQEGRYVKFPSGRYLTIVKSEHTDSYWFEDLDGSSQIDICIDAYDIQHHNWEIYDAVS